MALVACHICFKDVSKSLQSRATFDAKVIIKYGNDVTQSLFLIGRKLLFCLCVMF